MTPKDLVVNLENLQDRHSELYTRIAHISVERDAANVHVTKLLSEKEELDGIIADWEA